MIGIGFAERLAGGHHPIGSTEPDKTFALDLVAEPARHGWRALGTLRAESIVSGAAVQGVISREGDILRYRLSIDGEPRLGIEGQKLLRVRDPYASLSMFRGLLRDAGRDVAAISARVDLRSEWRFFLRHLTLSLRAS